MISLSRISSAVVQCLEKEVLSEGGIYAGEVGAEAKALLTQEIKRLEGPRMTLSKRLKKLEEGDDQVVVRLLTGEALVMPISGVTTVKEVKVLVGQAKECEPRYIRLLTGSSTSQVELKVRNKNSG